MTYRKIYKETNGLNPKLLPVSLWMEASEKHVGNVAIIIIMFCAV